MKLLAAVLWALLVFAHADGAQEIPVLPPLDAKVAHFDVTDAIMREGISALSQTHIKGLHLGYEEVLQEQVQQDPRTLSPHFSLHLENFTVRQILDVLCQSDARYTWSEDGDSVNVYPRAANESLTYLPALQIEQISFEDIKEPTDIMPQLAKFFPQQQVGYSGTGLGSDRYQVPWSARFDHLTVRQLMNRLAEHMGPQTSWVWGGGNNERMFTFLIGGFGPAYSSSEP